MGKSVCILTSTHPATDVRVFYREARTLAKRGFQVSVFADWDREENRDGVRIYPLRKPKNRFVRILLLYRFLIKGLSYPADIYHFHELELVPFMIILKMLSRKPVIFDIHEDFEVQYRKARWLVGRPMRSFLVSTSRLLLFISRVFDGTVLAFDYRKRYLFDKKPLCVLRNYPIKDMFSRFPASEDEKGDYVLYTGSISRRRGIEEMIEAVRIASKEVDVKLLLLGKPIEAGILPLIEANRDIVDYRGFFDWKKAVEIYRIAKAGLYIVHPTPGLSGNLPNKVFEYMAMGIPIIASGEESWRRYIEETDSGFIIDGFEPTCYAEKIVYLLKNKDEAKRLGANGRYAFETRFNWEVESKKLLSLYHRILKGEGV